MRNYLRYVVSGAVTSCAGISAALVCTVSYKRINSVSARLGLLRGEILIYSVILQDQLYKIRCYVVALLLTSLVEKF